MRDFSGSGRHSYYDPGIILLYGSRTVLKNWNFPNLGAPFWRIYYNSGEGASIIWRKKEIPIDPGYFYVISPDTEYGARLHKSCDHFFIHFQTAKPYDVCPDRIYNFKATSADLKMINDICELSKSFSENNKSISLRMYELCIRALRQVPDDDLRKSYSDRRVIKAVGYIEQNLANPIANEDLAAPSGMNVNSFARLFREHTGLSPQAFIAQRRIQEACLLLRFSDLTIDEIAERTGFCDRYYFTRIFTGQRKISPAAFRKLNH